MISFPAALSILVPMVVDPQKIFNFSSDVKPVATKAREFSLQDRQFIQQEIEKLLNDNIIQK